LASKTYMIFVASKPAGHFKAELARMLYRRVMWTFIRWGRSWRIHLRCRCPCHWTFWNLSRAISPRSKNLGEAALEWSTRCVCVCVCYYFFFSN
jgi:hypothetical protein